MKQTEILVAVKNAGANVLRGTSIAVMTLVVPPFLTRALSVDQYGAWALVMQLTAYVAYLDFGLQTAVGRYVAHGTETGSHQERDSIVSTAFVVLGTGALIGMLALLVLAGLVPVVFRQMPAALVGSVRLALLIVGASVALGLPASVISAVFIGLQRNEVPALTVVVSKLITAALLIVAVRHTQSLAVLGAVVAGISATSYAALYGFYRRLAPQIRIRPELVTWQSAKELYGYCRSLTVWIFGMILVTGLDLVIVGWFDFQSVAYYAVAASIVAFIIGTQNAIFGALISPVAVQHARGDQRRLGLTLIHSTRFGVLFLMGSAIPICFASRPLLTAWVGAAYAERAQPLLILLVIANVIRLSTTPYCAVLIGTGQQRAIVLTPILEGVVNLTVSLWAGRIWGALGVAIGTLAGSLVCLFGHVLYNMPRTRGVAFTRSEFVNEGLVWPLLTTLPTVITCFIALYTSGTLQVALWVLAASEFIAFAWLFGLTRGDRAFVGQTIRRSLRLAEQG